jgi:hypothetical protein
VKEPITLADLSKTEISVGEFIDFFSNILTKIAKGKWYILGFAIIGSLLGGSLIFYNSSKQKAQYILAVEEVSAPAWASLLAQFGLDGSGNNPSGVFQGESLLSLFKTRAMVERALLNKVNYKGSEVLLAEVLFTEVKGSDHEIFEEVEFYEERSMHSSVTDSALFLTYSYVVDEVIQTEKPEKKQGFIHLSCIHRDGELAMLLSKALIETVTTFYIEVSTTKARTNLRVLTLESDSVQRELNEALNRAAFQADLNFSPMRQTLRTESNRASVDAQLALSIYSEIVKNLKLAEIAVRKETPLITVIESPQFPLERVGFGLKELVVYGMFVGMFSGVLFVLIQVKE